MLKRTLILGAVIAVLVSALMISGWILDLITIQDLKETSGKVFAIVAVFTVAGLLITMLVKMAQKK
jgi:hypothetical protein